MKLKLGILAAVTAGVFVVLYWPIGPITITLEMPPGKSAEQFSADARTSSFVGHAIIVAVILAIAAWIGWRIVRRHNASR